MNRKYYISETPDDHESIKSVKNVCQFCHSLTLLSTFAINNKLLKLTCYLYHRTLYYLYFEASFPLLVGIPNCPSYFCW